MRIWKDEAGFDLGCAVAALGTFDGVHIGHQALIFRAMELAREMDAASVVCTFDRHPLSLLRPDFAPVPLMRLDEKLDKLEKMGVDGVVVRAFDREFAAMEPLGYLGNLSEKLRLRGIVAGFNYSFGAGGRGNADMIRSEADRLGYRAEIMDAVRDGDDTVSSTLIRSLLAAGEITRAERLMRLQDEFMAFCKSEGVK